MFKIYISTLIVLVCLSLFGVGIYNVSQDTRPDETIFSERNSAWYEKMAKKYPINYEVRNEN